MVAGGRRESLCNVLNAVCHAQPALILAHLVGPTRLLLLEERAPEGALRSANGKNAIKPASSLTSQQGQPGQAPRAS